MTMTFYRIVWVPVVCAGLLAVSTPAAHAQATGAISGTVLDAANRRPLSNVQVSIPGTGLGVLSNGRGQFLLLNVPAGEVEIRVRLIGYGVVARPVTVLPDETAALTIELNTEALALDEVVVTGTAGQARRREVGNSISQINVGEDAPPTVDVEQMLQGQAAGVSVMESGAQSGSGRQIRLRGNVSVAMSNQPLIYVDGVRIRSDMLPKSMLREDADAKGMASSSGSGTGTVASPLNDIDPGDIERIEVIKGAAATTLYGTEAASGVIQIFTKRGRAGGASWSAGFEQGINGFVQPFGTEYKPYIGLEPWLSRGHIQNYSLSVNGGTDDLGYYVSGSYNLNDGVLPEDWEHGGTMRGNFAFSPSSSLTFDWNTSIADKEIRNVPMGNNAEGLTLNVYRLGANYIGSEKKEDIDRLLEQEWLTTVNHVISGLTARHQATEKITNRVTVGYDRLNTELMGTFPYGFITKPDGLRVDRNWLSQSATVDYVGTLHTELLAGLQGDFSLGAQSVNTETISLWGQAEDFPGPGQHTLSSGAKSIVYEERQRVINAGVFGQALLGYLDRYFLTLGLRADGNSAFGQNLGMEFYPKASVSYVISDEPFFPSSFGDWKLRAAYGHAGRAPGAFDAVRTWTPAGWAGNPAFLPNTVGNANLGPERTAELEFGFDASMLNQRLTLDFTYYDATTTDALLPVQQVPTLGFAGSQLENVGVIQNWGIELAVNAELIDRPEFGWGLGVNFSYNQNELTDLGGSAPFLIGETGWVMEGQPVPVMVGTRILNREETSEPQFEANHVFGPNLPPTTAGLSSTISLPWRLELSGQAEYMGGHYVFDRASRNMASRRVWTPCQGPGGGYEKLANSQRDELTAFERVTCDASITPRDVMNFRGDFLKLRHVTLAAPLPEGLIPGARTSRITASFRNLRLWNHSDLPLFDPEMAGASGGASPVRAIVENVPAPSALLLNLRVSF